MRYCVCGAIFGSDHDHAGRLEAARIAWMESLGDAELTERADWHPIGCLFPDTMCGPCALLEARTNEGVTHDR